MIKVLNIKKVEKNLKSYCINGNRAAHEIERLPTFWTKNFPEYPLFVWN